jgi:hypothetical protein
MSAVALEPAYDWKPLRMAVVTSASTFGVVVPSNMHMEIREIDYQNLQGGVNEVIIRQIPSGNIRPPSSVILDDANLAANTSGPYSPRIPIRVVQESCVIEASASLGPANVVLAYRLKFGRP